MSTREWLDTLGGGFTVADSDGSELERRDILRAGTGVEFSDQTTYIRLDAAGVEPVAASALPVTGTVGEVRSYTDHAWGTMKAEWDGTNWRRAKDDCIVPTSTSDRAYLQELIDNQSATGETRRVIKLPLYDFAIDAPLILDEVLGLKITSEAAVHTDADSAHFCRIRLSDADEAAFIIQGCDGLVFEGLWVEGQNDINANFAGDPANLQLLEDDANYLYDLGGGTYPRTNRYSPHAAFVVDPLGTVPTSGDRYPSLVDDYGETSTSGVITWINCVARSFVAGWLVTPCTDLQLGDRMILHDCHSRDNRDGFNSCQDQNKIHELLNFRGQYQQFHSTTARYGNQQGCPPNILGGDVGLTKYLFLWANQYTVGNITGLYVESTLGLGFWGAGDSSTARPLNFNGCTLKLYQQATSDQIELDFHLQSHGIVNFNGCTIGNNSLEGVLRIHSNNPTLFKGCTFLNDSPSGLIPVVMSQYAGNEVQMNGCQARVGATASHHYGYWTNSGSKTDTVAVTAGADYTATFAQALAGDFQLGDVIEAVVAAGAPEQATDYGFASSTPLTGSSCPVAVVTNVDIFDITISFCAKSFHAALDGSSIALTRRRYVVTASGKT